MIVKLNSNVGLNIIKTQQFKSIRIEVAFTQKLSHRLDVTKRALLTSVIEAASNKYPSQQAVTLKLAKMYGATFGVSCDMHGSVNTITFNLKVVNSQFLNEHNVLPAAFDFLNEIINHPLISNNQFDTEIFERQKANLKTYLGNIDDDKQLYSNVMLNELYFDDIVQKLAPYGRSVDLEKINNHDIVEQYQRMITQDQVNVVIVGDVDEDNIASLVEKMEFPRTDRTFLKVDDIIYLQDKKEDVAYREEKQEINQGKLNLAYRLPVDLVDKDFLSAVMFNEIFGASPISLLFMNVREKHSLAYYADSAYAPLRNTIFVKTGIDFADKDKVLELISKQIQTIIDCDYSDELLDKMKLGVINDVLSGRDSQYNLANRALLNQLTGVKRDLHDMIKQISEVSKEDISRVAKQLSLQAVYFLNGVDE